MKLTAILSSKRFVFQCSYAERHVPREAGFRFGQRQWYTDSSLVAVKLRSYADDRAEFLFNRLFLRLEPWLSPLPAPPGDLALKPHQKEAAYFALTRNRSYLRLDPGTGKTIVAATVAQAWLDNYPNGPVVYVCPPSLVANVQFEMEKWFSELCAVTVMDTPYEFAPSDAIIVPDTLLIKPEVCKTLRRIPHDALLIVDEAHRFKTFTAKRTRGLFSITNSFKKVVMMTGTPMPNRPIELYPALAKLAHDAIDFMSEEAYGLKFCAGYEQHIGKRTVWDFSGASNMAVLKKRLQEPDGNRPAFMLRITKDVLKLPPLTEEVVTVAANMPPKLAKLDKDIYAAIDGEDVTKAMLSEKHNKDLHIATYRRLLGIEKAKLVVPIIKDILAETDESLLVFAHHKEVLDFLDEKLNAFPHVRVDGGTFVKDRQRLVERYQKDPSVRVLLANYTALGVGFNVTKATRILHVEYSWVPGDNDQSTARAHRMGQEKPVHVQYFCYANSLDSAILRSLMRKRKNISFI